METVGTRNVALNKTERQLIMRLVDREWGDADQRRMDTRPGSRQEEAAEEYQIMLSNVLAKLRGAVDEL